jgi:hypothetical protein
MLRKYGIGIFSIMIAIGAVAFTKSPKEKAAQTTYDFYFKLTSYTEGEVETNSNWETASKSCPTGSAKACKINVPAAYTHIDSGSGNRVLNTNEASNNVAINAVMGSGSDYVPDVSTSTGLNSRLNRS